MTTGNQNPQGWQNASLPNIQHRWTKEGARVTRWFIKDAKTNRVVITIRRHVPLQGFPVAYRRTWELSKVEDKS